MRECQQLFAVLQNVEFFNLGISERSVCYCRVRTWFGQYDVPALLFVPTPLVLLYYTRLVLKGSADDKTRLWTVALTEYVFLGGVIFVINIRHRDYASYYAHNPRFDHAGGSLLFGLLLKFIDALEYLGLYRLTQRMDTGPILTIMAFHQCSWGDWERTAVRDGLVLNNFRTAEV